MKLTLLFITVCSPALQAEMSFSQIQKYEAFDSWLYETLPIGSTTTEEKIIGLGKLIEYSEEEYSVDHAANPLKAVAYRFSGLEVSAIVEQTNVKKAYVTKVSIHSNNWVLSNGIAVGQNINVLSNLLVRPKDGTLNYCGVNNCIVFHANHNIINAITVTLYAD